MNRRNFIKGAVISSVALSSTSVFSGEEKYKVGKGYKLEDKVNHLVNKDKPSALEQGHVPVIELPERIERGKWFDVHVKVGFMKEHPSTPEHWITKVKLDVDGKRVARTRLRIGGMLASSATFRIRLEKDSILHALEQCNLHGKWISEPVAVKVT